MIKLGYPIGSYARDPFRDRDVDLLWRMRALLAQTDQQSDDVRCSGRSEVVVSRSNDAIDPKQTSLIGAQAPEMANAHPAPTLGYSRPAPDGTSRRRNAG